MSVIQIDVEGLLADEQSRYAQLMQKRQLETLTPDEHQELVSITEQVEAMNSQRIAHLIELAQLRKVSLDRLIFDLGLDKPACCHRSV